MIFSPVVEAVMLGLSLPTTILVALLARRRLPVWIVGVIGSLVAALVITALVLFTGVQEGSIQHFGDAKYLGIVTLVASVFGIPGAVAGNVILLVWRRSVRTPSEEG